jgi:hypothetical protein
MDDRRAAFAEAAALFLAGEAAGTGGQAPVVAFDGSVTRGDWEGVRASFAPEAVISDRRAPSLLGELDRDQYIESLRAYDDLVSGLAIESIRVYRWNGRGRVDLARLHESSDGGASRIPVVRVLLTGRDRIERFEIFDAPDVDRALARFDELTAGYESTAGSESQHH